MVHSPKANAQCVVQEIHKQCFISKYWDIQRVCVVWWKLGYVPAEFNPQQQLYNIHVGGDHNWDSPQPLSHSQLRFRSRQRIVKNLQSKVDVGVMQLENVD